MRYNSIILMLACSILVATPAHATERVAQKTQLNPSVHHDSTGLPTQVSGISASCGGANGTVVSSVPSGAAACAQGSRTVTDGAGTDGSYNWTCSSASQTVSCSAQTAATSLGATCGSANGTSVATLPTGSSACASGSQSSIDATGNDGSFDWICMSGSQTVSCSATNGGSTGGGATCTATAPAGDTCTATTASSPTCGCANGKRVTSIPSGTRACANGTFTASDSTASDGSYDWTCRGGILNLTSVACSAPKYSPACGSANGASVISVPSCSAACSAGAAVFSDATGSDGTFNWTCNVGSQSVSCSANSSGGSTPAPACGSANNTAVSAYPTGAAGCSVGTQAATSATYNYTYNWTCNSGSQSASCVAYYPAKCGSSNGQTVFGVWAWSLSGAVSKGACAVAAHQDGSNKRTTSAASNGYLEPSSFYKWDCVNGPSTVSCAANAVSNMVFSTDKTTYKRGQTGTFSWNCSANYPQATEVAAMAGDGTTVGTVFGPGWPSNNDLWSNGATGGPGYSAWPLSGSWTMDVTNTCSTANSRLGGKVTTLYVGVMCRGYLDPSASGDYGTSTSYEGLGWGEKQITIDCVN